MSTSESTVSCSGGHKSAEHARCVAVLPDPVYVSTRVPLNELPGHVHADMERIVRSLDAATLRALCSGTRLWDRSLHFADASRPELLLRSLLVLDSLNFCFWPRPGLEYDALARGIKVQ